MLYPPPSVLATLHPLPPTIQLPGGDRRHSIITEPDSCKLYLRAEKKIINSGTFLIIFSVAPHTECIQVCQTGGWGCASSHPFLFFSPFGQCLLFMRFWGRRNLSVARHTGLRVPFMLTAVVGSPQFTWPNRKNVQFMRPRPPVFFPFSLFLPAWQHWNSDGEKKVCMWKHAHNPPAGKHYRSLLLATTNIFWNTSEQDFCVYEKLSALTW